MFDVFFLEDSSIVVSSILVSGLNTEATFSYPPSFAFLVASTLPLTVFIFFIAVGRTVNGAEPSPANPSKPISFTSISWSAANLPATSPVEPPTTSTAPPANGAAAFLAALPATDLPFFTAPATTFVALPANPADKASTAPMAAPLPTAFLLSSESFSGSCNIFCTLSIVISPSISSCKSSEKVSPASIAAAPAPNPPIKAPADEVKGAKIPPAKPSDAPAPAPAAADAETSSDAREPI